ncbi:hypothetical protein [Streptomyces sp. NPDC059533]|uniref:hypothetical protein n=1 Tax=unclassified Streptomyces TaxID=2593676 RepID=UPI00365007EE
MPEAPTALADVFADELVTLSVPNERRAGARRRAERRRRSRMTLTVTLGVLLATAASLLVVRMTADGRTDRASEVVLTDDGPQQPAPLPDLPTSGAPSAPGGKATAKVAAGPAKKAAPVSLTPGPTASVPEPTPSETPSVAPSPSKSGKGGKGKPSPSRSASGSPTSTLTGGPLPSPSPSPTKTKCSSWWNPLCW